MSEPRNILRRAGSSSSNHHLHMSSSSSNSSITISNNNSSGHLTKQHLHGLLLLDDEPVEDEAGSNNSTSVSASVPELIAFSWGTAPPVPAYIPSSTSKNLEAFSIASPTNPLPPLEMTKEVPIKRRTTASITQLLLSATPPAGQSLLDMDRSNNDDYMDNNNNNNVAAPDAASEDEGSDSLDSPTVEDTEKSWVDIVASLEKENHRLRQRLAKMEKLLKSNNLSFRTSLEKVEADENDKIEEENNGDNNNSNEDDSSLLSESSFDSKLQGGADSGNILAKKLQARSDFLLKELLRYKEAYQNQNMILAECEKKLSAALQDKADVIAAKMDALKLQSKFQLTWVPEDSFDECLQCGQSFGFFNLQHNCRFCGRLFCANCTYKKCPIPSLGYTEPVRVCDYCYLVLLSKKNGKKIDSSTLESDQLQDMILKKYEVWGDQQKKAFFEKLLKRSSVSHLMALYKSLSTLLDDTSLYERKDSTKSEYYEYDSPVNVNSKLTPASVNINGGYYRYADVTSKATTNNSKKQLSNSLSSFT